MNLTVIAPGSRHSYEPESELSVQSKVVEGFDATVPDAATGTSDVNVTTRYDWTPTGNLAKTTDPNGHETAFEYNAAGQVTSETNPVGKSWTYSYDSLRSRIKLARMSTIATRRCAHIIAKKQESADRHGC